MPRSFFTDIQLNKNQLLGARYENVAVYPTGPAAGQTVFYTVDNTFRGWNGTSWIDLSQIIQASTTMRGEISTAANNPPFPVNPTVGDTYFITTAGGTVGGLAVEVGDQLVRSSSGWFVLQANLQAATQALAGFVRLATQAEANAGADLTTAISPGVLANFLIAFLYARKFRVLVSSLAANTATPITHGLNLANAEDMHCMCYQGQQQIELDVRPTGINTLTVTSNQTLGNVTVVVQG